MPRLDAVPTLYNRAFAHYMNHQILQEAGYVGSQF